MQPDWDEKPSFPEEVHIHKEHMISEPLEPSPMPGDTRVFGDDFYPINSKLEKADVDASIKLPMNEKENSTRENNVAMIKVV
ncbi:kinesin-like protein Klp10A-like, partial [Trifolium pratense]